MSSRGTSAPSSPRPPPPAIVPTPSSPRTLAIPLPTSRAAAHNDRSSYSERSSSPRLGSPRAAAAAAAVEPPASRSPSASRLSAAEHPPARSTSTSRLSARTPEVESSKPLPMPPGRSRNEGGDARASSPRLGSPRTSEAAGRLDAAPIPQPRTSARSDDSISTSPRTRAAVVTPLSPSPRASLSPRIASPRSETEERRSRGVVVDVPRSAKSPRLTEQEEKRQQLAKRMDDIKKQRSLKSRPLNDKLLDDSSSSSSDNDNEQAARKKAPPEFGTGDLVEARFADDGIFYEATVEKVFADG
jgi:hypothetical protein